MMDSDSFGVDMMQALGMLALVPFIGWGIYGLDRRYRRHVEWPLSIEAMTLLVVLLLVAFEMTLLRTWMRDQILFYVFAVLGLFLSCVALYAHMAISLTSRFIVDIVSPGEDSAPDTPRFGPAEILEHRKDYDGALQEYLVLARIYPRHPAVHLRVAETLLRLSRPEESVQWLSKSLRYLTTDENSLPVVSRLCEVHERVLKDETQARRVLSEYIARFPQSKHAEAIRQRLERLGAPETHALVPALVALEEAPLSEPEETLDQPARGPARKKKTEPEIILEPLEALEVPPVKPDEDPPALEPAPPEEKRHGGLDLM